MRRRMLCNTHAHLLPTSIIQAHPPMNNLSMSQICQDFCCIFCLTQLNITYIMGFKLTSDNRLFIVLITVNSFVLSPFRSALTV